MVTGFHGSDRRPIPLSDPCQSVRIRVHPCPIASSQTSPACVHCRHPLDRCPDSPHRCPMSLPRTLLLPALLLAPTSPAPAADTSRPDTRTDTNALAITPA